MIKRRLGFRGESSELGMTSSRIAAVRRWGTVMLVTNLYLTREDIVFIISVLTVCLSALVEILKLLKDKPYKKPVTS